MTILGALEDISNNRAGTMIDNEIDTKAVGTSCFVSQTSDTSFDVYLYGVIYELRGYVPIINLLKKASANVKITIYINSPGGSVNTGMVIVSAIRESKADVVTVNAGEACSMGSGILMAADKIRIERPSMTMFHDVIGGGRGTISLVMNKVLSVNEGADAFLFKRASLILTEDEIDAIRNKGRELFLSASQMTERLREAGLLEEVNR